MVARWRIIGISPAAFDEFRSKLELAGYDWVFDPSCPDEFFLRDLRDMLVRREEEAFPLRRG